MITLLTVFAWIWSYLVIGALLGGLVARGLRAACTSCEGRRWGSDCKHDAIGFFTGLFWPVSWPGIIFTKTMYLPTADDRSRKAESLAAQRAVKITNLERELGIGR